MVMEFGPACPAVCKDYFVVLVNFTYFKLTSPRQHESAGFEVRAKFRTGAAVSIVSDL
jgi:hypothetical protein